MSKQYIAAGTLTAALVFLPAIRSGAQTPAPAACVPREGLSFICNLGAPPEDLVALPGTRWLIASGMRVGGGLKLVDAQSRTARPFYDGTAGQQRPDPAYPTCGGAPEPARLSTHGLSLRPLGGGQYRLYAVGHGQREAIEIFTLDARTDTPSLMWNGCVPMPEGHAANAVAAFADGQILATVLTRPGTGARDFLEGRPTGMVVSWRSGAAAFTPLPGTELAGNNGIETEMDGDRFYVAATGERAIVEFSRRDPSRPLRRVRTPGFIPDNLHWDNGELLAAGMRDEESVCGGPWRVVNGQVSLACHRGFIAGALNPATLQWRVVAEGPPNPDFHGTAAALVRDRVLWLGSFISDRLAFRALP